MATPSSRSKEKQKEYARRYYEKHREQILEKNRQRASEWARRNPERSHERSKKWRLENPKWARALVDDWRKRNPEEFKAQARQQYYRIKADPERYAKRMAKQLQYQSERKKHDEKYALERRLRCRFTDLIRNGKAVKRSSVLSLIGCTLDELRLYIQRQFSRKMSWKNYGSVWHIDHIIPCSKFDLTDLRQQKICFNYLNLRPCFALENIKKGNKILSPSQLPLGV